MTAIILGLPSSVPIKGTTFWLVLIVGTVAEVHILTSGLISGGGQLGPIIELLGWIRRRPDYDRLAHGISKWVALLFAISSAVPFIFIGVILTGLAGHFWTTLVRITWVPLVFELFAFLFEVVLTYLWFYTWSALQGRYKPLHITIGLLLALDDFLQVLMINVLASYMLTPGSAPPSDIFRVIVNPSFYELQIHRIIANLAYVGYMIGAVAGIRFLRARTAEQRAYWDWMGSFGIVTGTLFTLFQPLVGYSYAKEVQLSSYAAWYNMMLGDLSNFFLVQIILLGIMFAVAGFYFASRLRRETAPGRRVVRVFAWGMVACTVLAGMPYQLALSYSSIAGTSLDKPFWEGGLINPLGAMIPFKVIALIGYTLLVIGALVWYLRGLKYTTWGSASRRSQRLLIVSVVLVMMMIVLMGVIRESARDPDLIFGQMTISQQPAATPSAPPAPSVP